MPVAGVGTLDRSLVAGEEEQLVLLDGSTDQSAKLIPLERIPGRREGVARVHVAVPQKFKGIAVKFVAAGFSDHVDRGGAQ